MSSSKPWKRLRVLPHLLQLLNSTKYNSSYLRYANDSLWLQNILCSTCSIPIIGMAARFFTISLIWDFIYWLRGARSVVRISRRSWELNFDKFIVYLENQQHTKKARSGIISHARRYYPILFNGKARLCKALVNFVKLLEHEVIASF